MINMKFNIPDPRLPYYPEERPEIIEKFISYCRKRGKIVIFLDLVKSCSKYRGIFSRVYMNKMINDPNQFIAYQSSISFDTDHGEVYPFQIRSEKYFPAYYKVLTEKLIECKFCPIKGYKQMFTKYSKIHVICMYCNSEVCRNCFDEITSVYYSRCNMFRCLICKELNWWND